MSEKIKKAFTDYQSELRLKICGLCEDENIRQVLKLEPDYIGFIFYKKSSRYIEKRKTSNVLKGFGNNLRPVKKTGVFVNENVEGITAFAERYNLDALQLHGNESPEFCEKLKNLKFEVIKAFSIDDNFDFEKITQYEGMTDKFLFDTKGKLPGGNGLVFNWEILKNYKGKTPFFLSGGIGIDSVKAIQKFKHPMLFGLDVNSKFEIEPGLKDVELIKDFIKNVKRSGTPCMSF